jgi:putative hemolysin
LAGLTIELVTIFILIGINAFLAMAELSLVSSQRIRLQQQAEQGNSGAAAALALQREPTRFLSTVQVGITAVGIVAGVFGGARVAERVSVWLQDAGLSEGLASSSSYVAVVLVLLYLSVIFGELVPKRIALHSPETIAARVVRPMQILALVGRPFVAILSLSTMFIIRVLGLRDTRAETVTEEDIRLMIINSAESGSVAEEEAELLDRVFHFGDRRVHEVMTARTETIWLDVESKVRDFYAAYAKAPHSRFPVFRESPDDVAGILGIKDVLAALAEGLIDEDDRIEPLLRPAYFIPESKLIGELFREMQSRGVQMAIAIDEFGGTAGIVTLEQLLEEMVGTVGDELRPEAPEFKAIDERTVQVDGSVSIAEAREELGIDIPDGPYDTIAGFVLDRLGHIPKEGEAVPFDGHRILVTEMRGPKIEMLRITRDQRVRLTLVRHALPDWADGDDVIDPGLDAEGRQQAQAAARLLGSRLSGQTPVWSGPSRRALETAALVGEALQAQVATDGSLDGLGNADLRRKLSLRELDEGVRGALAERQMQAWSLVERLLAETTTTDLVFVTHEAVIAALVCRVLGMELDDIHRFRLALASVSVVDFRPQRTILVSLNETHHLPAGTRMY